MTKEEKAKEYADNGTRFLGKRFHGTLEGAFLDGYNSAEQSSDETMIAFAKWYIAKKTTDVNSPTYSDKTLVKLFKETQNKEA